MRSIRAGAVLLLATDHRDPLTEALGLGFGPPADAVRPPPAGTPSRPLPRTGWSRRPRSAGFRMAPSPSSAAAMPPPWRSCRWGGGASSRSPSRACSRTTASPATVWRSRFRSRGPQGAGPSASTRSTRAGRRRSARSRSCPVGAARRFSRWRRSRSWPPWPRPAVSAPWPPRRGRPPERRSSSSGRWRECTARPGAWPRPPDRSHTPTGPVSAAWPNWPRTRSSSSSPPRPRGSPCEHASASRNSTRRVTGGDR